MQDRNTKADLIEGMHQAAAALAAALKEIELHVSEQHEHAQASADVDEMQRLQDADPFRWLADAKHSLQSGVMFAERAVIQPLTF